MVSVWNGVGVKSGAIVTALLPLAAILGLIILIRAPKFEGRAFILGAIAGACVSSLLVGLCFSAMSNLDVR